LKDSQCLVQSDLFKHIRFEICHGRLCDVLPDFVAEVEDLVSVGIRLSDVEVVADQGYQERIKHKIEKLVKNLVSLCSVRLVWLLACGAWRLKPGYIWDLAWSAK
jgi:hypothetical protein